MDDISLIAPFEIINEVSQLVSSLYLEIGLHSYVSQCFLIANSSHDLSINGVSVPFINYSTSSFPFSWRSKQLLEIFELELDEILKLEFEKQLKLFVLKVCCSGKVTHLLRTTDPFLSYEFCRHFNKLRTNFLSELLQVDSNVLKNHIFCRPDLGRVGFTSSKHLTKAAFIGVAKNFVFEFSNRYNGRQNLLSTTNSDYLVAVRQELEALPSEIWASCYSSDIMEIPARELISLKCAFKKLQNRLVKTFEEMDYSVRLSLAKTNNPSFANF
ncbi:hypothetical protein RCL1_000917 [Eukaryota sp. TZLM3-RCL]